MPFGALREKALPATLTAPCERGTPAFCAHTRTKAMLAFAGAFGWLVRAFHKSEG